MSYIFVFGFCPIKLEYVSNDDADMGWAAGKSWGPVIKIKEAYKDDEGLLQHEIVHSKQFYRTCGLWSIFYRFISSWRYESEVEAYAVQLSYVEEPDIDRVADLFAGFVVDRYNLDVKHNEAKEAILSEFKKLK
jgi:hypothetical protein